MKGLIEGYRSFENWFNVNLGWFFVNGNKINQFDKVEDN